jgi:PAS domain S-box-containing protein
MLAYLKKYVYLRLLLFYCSIGLLALLFSTLVLFLIAVQEIKVEVKAHAQFIADIINSVADHENQFDQEAIAHILDTNLHNQSMLNQIELGRLSDNKLIIDFPPNLTQSALESIYHQPEKKSLILRAINGQSSTEITKDFLNHWVIGGFQTIPVMQGGLVFKQPLSAISAPFLHTFIKECIFLIVISVLVTVIWGIILRRQNSNTIDSLDQIIYTQSRRLLLRNTIWGLVAVISLTLITNVSTLYRLEYQRQLDMLNTMTQQTATLINTVTEYNLKRTHNNFDEAKKITLAQLKQSIDYSKNLSKTIELVIGEEKDNAIHFVLSSEHRYYLPKPVPLNTPISKQMQEAIENQQGIIENSLDYNGNIIVGAYAPLPALNMGIVFKIPSEEIKAPFKFSSMVFFAFGITMIVILSFATTLNKSILFNLKKPLILHRAVSNINQHQANEKKSLTTLLTLIVIGISIYIDNHLPLGVGGGLTFLVAFMIILWINESRHIFSLASILTLFTIAGTFNKDVVDIPLFAIVITRCFSISAMWFIAIIMAKQNENQAQLHEKEQALINIIRTLPEPTLIINHKGLIVLGNEKGVNTLGIAAPVIIGTPLETHLIHNTPTPIPLMDIISKTHEPKTIKHQSEWFLKTKKHAHLPVDISISPIKADEKSYYVLIFHDVSLEHMRQKQLQEAKERAEELMQSKSSFLANMSHEIRTPMNAIIGMTSLALKTSLPDQTRSYLTKSINASHLLLNIINDILDYSKLDSAKMDIEPHPFNLQDVTENIETMVGMKAKDKNLDFSINIAPDVPLTLMGDSLRLNQILINLGNNAVKFTEKGYVTFDIKSKGIENNIVSLEISVKDSGIGIEKAKQKLLFTAFTQADVSITRRFGGTGLGLSICKALVTLMKGNIRLKSVPNQGTSITVNISLPIVTDNYIIEKLIKTKENAVNSENTLVFDKQYVLLVEDNDINLEVAINLLESFNLKIETASNGQEAVDKVLNEKNKFDLILMDCYMPVMDGLTATTIIKANQKFAHIPIIALTASVTREDKATILKAGMDMIVAKPIDETLLFNALSQYLKPHKIHNTVKTITTQAPQALCYLDWQKGLGICQGNEALYKKILQKFADKSNVFIADIELALNTDKTEAKSLIHKLKGVSGNIGASKLFDACKHLELSLSSQNELDLSELKTLFNNTINEIGTIIVATSTKKNQNSPSKKWIKEQLESLAQLLNQADTNANEVFHALENTTFGETHKESMSSIKIHLSEYRYDEAQALVETLITAEYPK